MHTGNVLVIAGKKPLLWVPTLEAVKQNHAGAYISIRKLMEVLGHDYIKPGAA